MCGRFTLHHHAAKIVERFHVEEMAFSPAPRYNIAPGELVGAIILGSGGYSFEAFKWGLVPSANRNANGPLINSRIESLGQQRILKESFARRRCLVPADGFYEWRGRKSPFYFRRKDYDLFAFAGIWDQWRKPDDPGAAPMRTLTIITTAADMLVGPIHDRMPVIVPRENERLWLDPSIQNPADLKHLTECKWDHLFERYPVSMLVNRAGSDSPEMLQEAEPEATLFGLV